MTCILLKLKCPDLQTPEISTSMVVFQKPQRGSELQENK